MSLRATLLRFCLLLLKRLDSRQPNLAEIGTKSIKSILVISNTAMGDTLLSTPAMSSIRKAYPSARISILIHRAYQSLFSQHPDIDDWIFYAGGYRYFFSLVLQLRRRHFDLVAILHSNEPQATPMAYLSGARFIFKLPNDNAFRFLLTNNEPVQRWEHFAHGIDQRLAVAALAGAPAVTRRMSVPLDGQAKRDLGAWLSNQGVTDNQMLIAIQPGASTTSRRWQSARFRELIGRLLKSDDDLRIVVTGSSAELELAKQITKGNESERLIIASGAIVLNWLPHLLQRCRLLITGDTGTMHLAIAVGTPVLALFAVSDHRRSGPTYDLEKHRVIQKWRTCDPCLSKRCPFPEPICMENISVDEVFCAARDMIASNPGKDSN